MAGISRFGDFMLKSSEFHRMVRTSALIRDKTTLIQAEDFWASVWETKCIFPFHFSSMWRGQKSFQSLLPWELQWFLFLQSLRSCWPCPRESGKSRIWKWDTDLHQCRSLSPSLMCLWKNFSSLSKYGWVIVWPHVSTEGHLRGFSRFRGIPGSHIVPHFLFGNHFQNQFKIILQVHSLSVIFLKC